MGDVQDETHHVTGTQIYNPFQLSTSGYKEPVRRQPQSLIIRTFSNLVTRPTFPFVIILLVLLLEKGFKVSSLENIGRKSLNH